jgi:hypothetical protein
MADVSDGSKERIRLQATFVNNIASGFFLFGFLAPGVAVAKGPFDLNTAIIGAVAGGVCVLVSIVLHLLAARHLREMDGE